MVGQNRDETWRSVLDDAQSLGRPNDYIAYPQDLRTRWGLGPGRVSLGQPNQAGAAAAQLPAEARAQLKEGIHTTFGNGQTWTLQNGNPVQVQQQGK
jgi:hypothetical protein